MSQMTETQTKPCFTWAKTAIITSEGSNPSLSASLHVKA